VLGLFFMTAWGLRKLSKRVSFTPGSRLTVLDRAGLGKDSTLFIVSVCGKLMLIGVSGQTIEKLAELEMSEDEYFAAADGKNTGNANFFDVFGGIFKSKQKPSENDTEIENESKDENEGNS